MITVVTLGELYSAEEVAEILGIPTITFHHYVWHWGVVAPWAVAMAPGKGGDIRGPHLVRFWDLKGVLEWKRFVDRNPCNCERIYELQTPTTVSCVTLLTLHYLSKIGYDANKLYRLARQGVFPEPIKELAKGDGKTYRYYGPGECQEILAIMRRLGG